MKKICLVLGLVLAVLFSGLTTITAEEITSRAFSKKTIKVTGPVQIIIQGRGLNKGPVIRVLSRMGLREARKSPVVITIGVSTFNKGGKRFTFIAVQVKKERKITHTFAGKYKGKISERKTLSEIKKTLKKALRTS